MNDEDRKCAECGESCESDPHTDPRTGSDVCVGCCPVCNGEIDIDDLCPGCSMVSDKGNGKLCSACLPF